MDFSLTYRGELGTKRNTVDAKHELREGFAKQLDVLWLRPDVEMVSKSWTPDGDSGLKLLESVGEHHFAPLVHSKLGLVAELEIFLLRPGQDGNLIGYDLDNRLKILFDSLRYPQQKQEIPPSAVARPPENPMKVLLEDDRLVTGLSVRTSQLLDDDVEENFVDLRIKVTLKASRRIWGNMGLV